MRRLTLVFIVIALSTAYLWLVVPDCLAHRAACLPSPDAPRTAPTVYRILQPTIEGLLAPHAEGTALLFVDMFIQAVAVMFTIPLLYAHLRRYASDDRALIGVLIYCIVNLVAYHYFMRAISTSLEVLFVVAGLALLREENVK